MRLGQQGLLSPRSRAATSYAHGTAAASTSTPDPCLLELSNHNWYDECDPGFGGAATSSPALSWDAREAAAPTDHHHECLVVVSHKLPHSIVASTAGVPVAAGGRTLPANAPCAPCVRHSLVLKSEGRTPGFFTISFRSPY